MTRADNRNTHIRIAIDIGGTFTDLQVLDEKTGACHAHKIRTTPEDPSQGLLIGLKEAAEKFSFTFDDVGLLIHGTTIATNAVLERKLPTGALITTAGFEDVLEIGRHLRQDIYASKAEARPLLIPRALRFGITERIRADGSIECPLNEQDLLALARHLEAAKVETIAVTFLHAYANREHEERAADILTTHLPHIPVSISADISPEFREFERSSTTVLNALLQPVVGTYLAQLEARLKSEGFTAPVFLVQSNGGVATPHMAAQQPVRLLLSGPSGGATAAETIARGLKIENLVAVDMGGTSYDVSLVEEGRIRTVHEGNVGGCPVRIPMVEMRTIGAGGGSIAGTTSAGSVFVGPQSAGADPGPACYGHAGRQPTVTDANVFLGRIDADQFLGGTFPLDKEAAERALTSDLAGPLGLSPEAAAEGILQIAVSHMAGAIRVSLFEKGLDPEDFSLISFGGAGGLHACETAAELGIGSVIFPKDPGTLSAWGMLYADISHDFTRACLMPADDGAIEKLSPLIEDMQTIGHKQLERDGIPGDQQETSFTLDLRYRGQAYEISTPFEDTDNLETAVQHFHHLHQAQFAHSDEVAVPEIVNLRLKATGILSKPQSQSLTPSAAEAAGNRTIYLDGAWRNIPVYERAALTIGAEFSGPLIVEEDHSTLLLPANWQLKQLETGELIAHHEGEDMT